MQASENCLIEALQIYQKYKNAGGCITCYKNMADIYITQQKFDVAIIYYNDAFMLAEKNGLIVEKVSLFGKLGNAFLNKQNYEKARDLYREQFLLAQEIGLEKYEAFSLSGLFASSVYLKDYENIGEYFSKGVQKCIKVGEMRELANLYLTSGRLSMSQGKLNEAEKLFKSGLSFIRDAKNKVLQEIITEELERLQLLKKMVKVGVPKGFKDSK